MPQLPWHGTWALLLILCSCYAIDSLRQSAWEQVWFSRRREGKQTIFFVRAWSLIPLSSYLFFSWVAVFLGRVTSTFAPHAGLSRTRPGQLDVGLTCSTSFVNLPLFWINDPWLCALQAFWKVASQDTWSSDKRHKVRLHQSRVTRNNSQFSYGDQPAGNESCMPENWTSEDSEDRGWLIFLGRWAAGACNQILLVEVVVKGIHGE